MINKLEYGLILLGNLIASILFGLYMSNWADQPTWEAHYLQWFALSLGALTFFVHGVVWSVNTNRIYYSIFAKIGLAAAPFLICPVGYVFGYNVL